MTDAKALKQKGRLAPRAIQLDHVHADGQLLDCDFNPVTRACISHAEPAATPLKQKNQPSVDTHSNYIKQL
jgi:hypothetical protein